jgi:hypothetical protein
MLNTLIPVESHRHRQCRMNICIYIYTCKIADDDDDDESLQSNWAIIEHIFGT